MKKIPSNITISPTKGRGFAMCQKCKKQIQDGVDCFIIQTRSLEFGNKGKIDKSLTVCAECKEEMYG